METHFSIIIRTGQKISGGLVHRDSEEDWVAEVANTIMGIFKNKKLENKRLDRKIIKSKDVTKTSKIIKIKEIKRYCWTVSCLGRVTQSLVNVIEKKKPQSFQILEKEKKWEKRIKGKKKRSRG